MADQTVVGVDVGGSHITAARVDLKVGTLQPETLTRAHVQANGTKEEIIKAWTKHIQAAAGDKAKENTRIGIAMPGPFDYEKGISLMKFQDKYDALYGLHVKELLADELKLQPGQFRFMNDAACFLQGEAFGGAAKGAKQAIGVTLGTGLGSAIYKDGLAADAALWCVAYKDGIAEDYLSGRWLVKRYHSLSGVEVPHVKALIELLPEYPLVQEVFDEFGEELGRFLAPYIHQENSEMLVIGGNIAQSLELILPQLRQTLAEHAIAIPIKRAQLGEEAALIGAASLWEERPQ